MREANEYKNGRESVIDEMIDFVKHEIEKVKSQNSTGNSFRQITKGGKLLAYNKVLEKLNVKKEKTINYKEISEA